jgi:hypothetical protein
MKTIIKYIILLIVINFSLINLSFCGSEKISPFKDLGLTIINSSNEAELIKNINFFEELLKDENSINESLVIRDELVTILLSEKSLLCDIKSKNNSVITPIDIYLKKLNLHIDPKWKFVFIETELWPDVPDSFPGMDPESIKDPIAKKKYLFQIEENNNKNKKIQLINEQQNNLRNTRGSIFRYIVANIEDAHKSGWSRDGAIERFGLNEECKSILLKYIERDGK